MTPDLATEKVPLDGAFLVARLRSDELRSIENDVTTGLTGQILKALDERGRAQELIRQQYTGRYPFELLQNANDAAIDEKAGGAVYFAVSDHALLVADQGVGFGPEQIEAICSLGRSSKDPRKSIGYKGLGFKSVGEITDRPQIISDAVSFGFNEARARIAVGQITGALDSSQRLPVYAFPFDLTEPELQPDLHIIEELRQRGFATVLRLPYRDDVTREIVQEHVQQTIVPRLLLFLDATDSLQLTGTTEDFAATVVRDRSGICTETLLQIGARTEHWLVFDRRLRDLDRFLVDPLGDAWRLVEEVHVAVAVPLDDDSKPVHSSPQPIHVYFPTDEQPGLSVVLQGDFALDLDRRHIAKTPEALPYNMWLANEMATLVAEAAENLAERFPSDPSVVATLAPAGTAAGFGKEILKRCREALLDAAFVPGSDGSSRTPGDVLLLPTSLQNPRTAHRFLDLSQRGEVVTAEVEAYPPSRRLLAEFLETPQLTIDTALGLLHDPGAEYDTSFYQFLLAWAEVEGRSFPERLSNVPCVRIHDGSWVAPTSGVFFPRQRDDVRFPEGLHVPIVAIPDIDGLRPLLESAGVRPFEWRQLIPDFVLPLLTDPEQEDQTRHAAIFALRGYYETERSGDPRMHALISQILLPAHDVARTVRQMQPAGSLYFSKSWLHHDHLEQIYGPFGRAEFLDLEPPEDQEDRRKERDFWEWIGVSPHPRIDERRADQRDQYFLGGLHRHPHRRYGELWTSWQTALAGGSLAVCDEGHDNQQQLRVSFGLDRFPQVVTSGDANRLILLWKQIRDQWSQYERALKAEIECRHGWHKGDTTRSAPSLFRYMLENLDWVSCIRGGKRTLARPDRAWRVTRDTPPRILERVAVLDPALDVPHSAPIAVALGVVDAARPRPDSVVGLLRDLEREGTKNAEILEDRDFQLAARWAMRTLNDALQSDTRLEGSLPLLCRYDGRHTFATDPLVAGDPLLAETWEPVFPILDAERDLRRLHEALNLRLLDDLVIPHADPRHPRPDLQPKIESRFRGAAPYIAAVAIDQVPSRENEVVRGLTRLELSLCEELVLKYELDGEFRSREEAVTFIAIRMEEEGIVKRRIGTAHLELDPLTHEPHWYAFGPHLAQFLGVPTQGDAFALLLAASKEERQRYLASKRISMDAVEEATLELARSPNDDIIQALLDIGESPEGIAHAGEPTARADLADSLEQADGDQEEELAPLPDLDYSAISMADAEPAIGVEADAPQRSMQLGLGPPGPIDHIRQTRIQHRIGNRGEKWAYEGERRRVAQLGLDPDLVVWQSEQHEFAPYDIESLDGDGQRIYIEVKSTVSSDPSDAFDISAGELLFAIEKRSNYCIYRVTDAHTPRPSITRYNDPIGLLHDQAAKLRLSGARLALFMNSAQNL